MNGASPAGAAGEVADVRVLGDQDASGLHAAHSVAREPIPVHHSSAVARAVVALLVLGLHEVAAAPGPALARRGTEAPVHVAVGGAVIAVLRPGQDLAIAADVDPADVGTVRVGAVERLAL